VKPQLKRINLQIEKEGYIGQPSQDKDLIGPFLPEQEVFNFLDKKKV